MSTENDGYQQTDEYRRWLADEEAQREYQKYLDEMTKINRVIDEFFAKVDGKNERTS